MLRPSTQEISMQTVGVMLTRYKRNYTDAQMVSMMGQTFKPSEIVVWNNGSHWDWPGVKVIHAPFNAGVWPRFWHCLSFDTDFVAVFDDDTIPGHKWLQTCLENFQERPGVYGAAGVIFPESTREPRLYTKADRPGPAVEVDVVGHCWFMPTDWIRYVCGEPRTSRYDTAGEDYHVCWSVQKHLGVKSYIPMIQDERSQYGTLLSDLGTDDVALYRTPGEEDKKKLAHQLLWDAGWETCRSRAEKLVEIVSPTDDEVKDD